MSAVTAVLNILFKTPLKCLTLFTKEVTRNANTSSLTQTGYKPSTNHTAVLAIADLAIHYVFKEKLLLLHFQPDAMDNKNKLQSTLLHKNVGQEHDSQKYLAPF
jgi:hypothetical protein